jgi:hypothetical protein
MMEETLHPHQLLTLKSFNQAIFYLHSRLTMKRICHIIIIPITIIKRIRMSTRLPRRYRGNRPENSNSKLSRNFPSNTIISTQVKNPTVIRHNNHNNHYVSKPIAKTVIMTQITLKKFANMTHKPQHLSKFQSAPNAASLSNICSQSCPVHTQLPALNKFQISNFAAKPHINTMKTTCQPTTITR